MQVLGTRQGDGKVLAVVMWVLGTCQGDEKVLAVVMQILETCQGDEKVLAVMMWVMGTHQGDEKVLAVILEVFFKGETGGNVGEGNRGIGNVLASSPHTSPSSPLFFPRFCSPNEHRKLSGSSSSSLSPSPSVSSSEGSCNDGGDDGDEGYERVLTPEPHRDDGKIGGSIFSRSSAVGTYSSPEESSEALSTYSSDSNTISIASARERILFSCLGRRRKSAMSIHIQYKA
ncbi:hypothetical protein E2C01_075146 [Portunus trituberculatus]|uniref:Uncharacterized protein n=1 Tax=Portunus trituberculatus TaxID=210409 RepID=A0A5B7IJ59_PORTR|nr:hypothetical protein [Portunus trituberculatus]